jgi:hypothetical protein
MAKNLVLPRRYFMRCAHSAGFVLAAEVIRSEINVPIPGQRVQTLGRIVCLLRKDR